jgi:hypothetical protein
MTFANIRYAMRELETHLTMIYLFLQIILYHIR